MSAASSRLEDNAHVIEEASDKIITVPNVISFIRLCLVPVFFILLFQGQSIPATLVFAVAAGTDFVDGQIARRTHSVSKLGQLLDPAVDRILMISGVLGAYLMGRLPLWIILIVVARDLLLLYGGFVLTIKYRSRVPVVYIGKVGTTLLFCGFALLLLNIPLMSGLGVTEAHWLPGFNHDQVCAGIWLVYVGLVIGVATAVHYVHSANALVKRLKQSSEVMR